MQNNVSFNHTLLEYNNKYRNYRYKLLRLTRKEVEDFDKKKGFKVKGFLLKGRKWWYIKETDCYHEIPKKLKRIWFANLAIGWQIATCAVLVGIIVTGITVPTVIYTQGNTPSPKPGPEPGPVPPVPTENVKITFDSGEGEFEETSNATKIVEVKNGTLWKDVEKPKVKHYDKDFNAYTINNKTIDDNYAFSVDTTVKAIFNDRYFTVTFDADEGTWEKGKTQTISVKNHTLWKNISDLPKTNPEKDDGLFNCWSLDKSQKIDGNYEIKGNTTVYAKYDAAVTLTFNANYGSWASKSNVSEKKVKVLKGKTWGEIKDKVPTNPSRTSFEFDKWHLSDSITEDISKDEKFNSNQEIICTWIAKEKIKDMFEDDSVTWKEIVDLSENGFNALANTFRKGVANPTFIGATRNLTVLDSTGNPVKYKVRVIDEQADDIKPEAGKEDINKATLTFEFVDCINIDDVGFASDKKDTNKWSESNIKAMLSKGDGNSNDKTIYDRITEKYDDSTLLTEKFMAVNKLTDSSGTTEDKLFIPALSELGFTMVPGSTTEKVEEEGYVYKYYKNNNDEERFKKKKNTNFYNYWLRSNEKNSNINVWSIGSDGNPESIKVSSDSENKTYTTMSVAPCFCLGKTNNIVNVTYSLGEDDIAKENRTIFFSGDDYKDTREIKYETEKNTSYTAFVKTRDTAPGSTSLPSVYKKADSNTYEFKHWYVASDNTKTKISDDYLIQERNLVLYPYFEKKETTYKPGLTITSLNDNPVTVNFQFSTSNPTFQYSTDNGVNYTTVTSALATPIKLENKGDAVIITSGDTANPKALSKSETDCTKILIKEDTTTIGGRASLSGDIRTLIDYKNYLNITDIEDATDSNQYAFSNLFGGSVKNEGEIDTEIKGLEDASELELGFTNTSQRAFNSLFAACTTLKYAPKQLSPIGIKTGTYWNCFACCTSLETSPILADVSECGERAYYKMFICCAALEKTPKLFATKLGKYAYMSMFKKCTSLKVAPELPENIEVDQEALCGMFHTCTALITAPKKINISNTISQGCCQNMFESCSSLKVAPEIQVTTLDTSYTRTAGSLYGMFNGCTNLSYVKIYFDLYKYQNNTEDWMKNVTDSSTSIFECPKDPSGTLPTGDSGVPSKWQINYF